MHWFKVSICALCAWGMVAVLGACAGTERSEMPHADMADHKLALLDSTYTKMLEMTAAMAPADSILPLLTDGSRDWLDTIERAAQTESREQVERRPFHEIMTIVTYRLLLRENQFAGIPEHRMLRLATGQHGILQKVSSLKLGPFEVKNDRGSRGLAGSPKVPVLVFAWDDRAWRLDLVETLPLVTRGLETIGVKKDWTPAGTVLYILDKAYHNVYRNVDESLLEPVPSI